MEKWDLIRFVYETEESLALGGVAAASFTPYSPAEPELNIPTGGGTTPGSGGEGGPRPISPEDEEGNDQDKIISAGGHIVPPCWLINEYEGKDGWMENGVWKTYTGEFPLTRGPVAKVRTVSGYGLHGDGAWPDNFQGYRMDALDENGAVLCTVYGWTTQKCRYPGSAFPLDAPACTGQIIGSDSSNVGANLGPTMWQRFEDTCLKPQYPDCGPWEE